MPSAAQKKPPSLGMGNRDHGEKSLFEPLVQSILRKNTSIRLQFCRFAS